MSVVSESEKIVIAKKVRILREHEMVSVCPHCGAPIYMSTNLSDPIEAFFTCACRHYVLGCLAKGSRPLPVVQKTDGG